MATIKLYDKDAYQKEFEATVVNVTPVKQEQDTLYDVLLDQTLFFPEEGGQTCDRGVLTRGGMVPLEITEEMGEEKDQINTWNVLDVQVDADQEIHHIVDAPIVPGTEIHGCIDWQHRFYNMQQHTGEHIFSGLVYAAKGYHNVGFHLSDSIVTMDYDGMLTEEEIRSLEVEVNERIVANLPVQCRYITEAEAKTLEYRSKIEIQGPIRIVTIPHTDVCACCAPHVHDTGEVGMLKVVDVQKYKGGVRLSILCGFRALADYRQKQEILQEAARALSVPMAELPDAISKEKREIAKLKGALSEANTKRMELEVEKLNPQEKHVVLFAEDIPNLVMRNTVNQLMEMHPGFCGIFNKTEGGYQFIIGSKQENAKDMAEVLREKFHAKCGGSEDMIQGSVEAAEEEIRSFFL